MGNITNVAYGYGFETTEITDAKTLRFLKNHAGTLRKLSEEFSTALQNLTDEQINEIESTKEFLYETPDDLYEKYSDLFDAMGEVTADEYYRLKDTIAYIIATETEIEVDYEPAQEECYGEECIMLREKMPWHISEKEKNLTPKKFDEILIPYLEELGLPADPESNLALQDLAVEYYG